MALYPRESGEFIVKSAKYLKINKNVFGKLKNEVINGIKNKIVDVENFSQNAHHPKSSDKHAIEWIFVVDTLNFCFWTPDDDTKWKVRNETGYFALCAALNRAMEEGIDITNSSFYSQIDYDQLASILRSDNSDTTVPLLKERVSCLHEVGKVLMEKYNGKFENCIKRCENSAKKLLDLVVAEFPCFRDEADYAGQRVSFYKRAQILIGDLWACFCGEGLGKFNDIEAVTMFADYRVPQVLVHFECVQYSSELMDILKKDIILQNGDEMEVEIRGASIYVVEELKKQILDDIEKNKADISSKNLNSILLDHFLWDYRRRHAKDLAHIPFHKVLSIYY